MNEPAQGNPEEQKSDELVNGPSNRPDMGTQKFTIVKNSGNDSRLPEGNLRFVLGYVDESNDPGAEEIAAYVPTRREVIELVKCWYGELLYLQWFFFMTGVTGGSDIRREHFARKRIQRAATAIGEGAVDKAIIEVRDAFRSELGDARLWNIFLSGDREQWAAVRDEWGQKQFDKFAADDLERLEQLEKESPGAFIAIVFCAHAGDKSRVVLMSPADSELGAALQASGQFEIVIDRSRLGALRRDENFRRMGFLRATRHNAGWLFEFPDSSPGTAQREYLESVAGGIKELLGAGTGKGSRPA
jgi:hypothetical protein